MDGSQIINHNRIRRLPKKFKKYGRNELTGKMQPAGFEQLLPVKSLLARVGQEEMLRGLYFNTGSGKKYYFRVVM
jgi:hypothetical protein